jgi:hemerythrin superfamily protein
MASIAIMVAGAVVNATCFTGSMYLAKYFDKKHEDKERIRHDKALEKYQRDMGEWQKEKQKYDEWLSENYMNKKQADENLSEVDNAFVLYSKASKVAAEKLMNKPDFKNYYSPSQTQKKYEIIYTVGAMGLTVYAISKIF